MYSTGNTDNVFKNSHFLNGTAGIYYEGSSGNLKSNLTIEDNTFENYMYGMNMSYLSNTTISGNNIINASSFNSAATNGIYGFHLDNDLNVSNNFITLVSGNSRQGIELQACVGSISEVGLVANNMIVVGGSGTVNGVSSGSTS